MKHIDVTNVRVVIIGGGGTGAALAYDLATRGFTCTVIERGELTSGTTGRHHGQLHSGARYAMGDREIARECMEEVNILRRIAADTIEMNYGLFLALTEEDETFVDRFLTACDEAGIPARQLLPAEALRYEPAINPATRTAVLVPDGTFDAFRLPLQFFASARARGARIRPWHEAIGIDTNQGVVSGVTVRDLRSGPSRKTRLSADIVINAGGPWAGHIARLAGVTVDITPAPGTLIAVRGRLCNMVVSRLRPPGDGDIVVPQRKLSIIGTTQWTTDNPDALLARDEDVPFLMRCADELVPGFSDQPIHAVWAAARPLAGAAGPAEDGRAHSRDFAVVHHKGDGAAGLYTIIGGKATTLRAMAQITVDRLCSDLGVTIPCTTHIEPLLSHRDYYRRVSA